MSKIAIKVEGASDLMGAITLIRRVTGLPLSDIKGRIGSGKSLLEYKLFYNDHDETAGQLRALVSGLRAQGARLHIYELDDDQTLSELADASVYEIAPEVLFNILDEHENAAEEDDEIDEEE